MATIIQLKRGSTSRWETVNPILAIGEIGMNTTNWKWKLGNGINHWNDIPYRDTAKLDIDAKALFSDVNDGIDDDKYITSYALSGSLYRRIYEQVDEPTSPIEGDLWIQLT